MKTAKIEYISTPESWEGKMGTMYQANIRLDDGTEGQVNMKTPDRWTVGDEVEVAEHKETNYGAKMKIQKPGGTFTGPSGTRKSDPEVQRRIDASWAIGQALTRLPADANVQDAGAKNRLYKDALALLEVRDSVIKTLS